MKTLKKMVSGFLALALALSMAVVSAPATAEAAAETGIKSCPSKIRIYPGYADDRMLELELKSAKYYVKSVKSSSKNLKAEVTEEAVHYNENNGIASRDENTVSIGMFAKKEGKYTVTVTIGNEDNAKFSYKKKVTVFAKTDNPFKKITVNGKSENWDRIYSSKKKIKFAVTAASGYTIQKIEIGTYKSTTDEKGNIDSELTYKKQSSKKSASFTLSTKPYTYSYNYEYTGYSKSQSSYWRQYMNAPTIVRITYKDKWTKQSDSRSYWFYYIN